jgi:hypothetical protein
LEGSGVGFVGVERGEQLRRFAVPIVKRMYRRLANQFPED